MIVAAQKVNENWCHSFSNMIEILCGHQHSVHFQQCIRSPFYAQKLFNQFLGLDKWIAEL